MLLALPNPTDDTSPSNNPKIKKFIKLYEFIHSDEHKANICIIYPKTEMKQNYSTT